MKCQTVFPIRIPLHNEFHFIIPIEQVPLNLYNERVERKGKVVLDTTLYPFRGPLLLS